MHNGIGIVLFMHCNLGQAFLDALQENNGYYNPAQFKAVSFTYEDDMQAKEIELIETMRAVEKGNGVIVLTDSIGGAIGHLAVAVRSKLENEGKKAEIIFDANSRVLASLVSLHHALYSFEDVVSKALERGKKAITSIGTVMADEPHWAGGRAAPVNEGPWPGQV